jgi:hypothetical protein
MIKTFEEQIQGRQGIVDQYGNIWFKDIELDPDAYTHIGQFSIANIVYDVYMIFGILYVKTGNQVCRITTVHTSNHIGMKCIEIISRRHQEAERAESKPLNPTPSVNKGF